MIEATCQCCGKQYIPKSNNSKYCSRKCDNKVCAQRRKQRRHTDKEFREHEKQLAMARWKERYHNEPGFKERHKKKVIEQRKNNPNGKESHNASQQKYYRKNHEYILEWIKKYAHSEAGIKIRRRSKNNRRNLGSNELFENIFDEPIVWHHIDDINMVAIPKDIHELHPGNPRERHREYLMPIVKQLYPEIQLLVQ